MLLQSVNKLNISDNIYDHIINFHKLSIRPQLEENKLRKFITLANKFSYGDNKLFISVKSKTLNTKGKLLEVIPPRKRNDILKQLYEDPLTSKNGRDSMHFQIINRYANIPRNYIFDWLKSQTTYQIHYQQKREKTLRVEDSKEICYKLMIDLVDLSGISGFNSQHKYLLTAIDTFSRFGFAESITQKTKAKIIPALQKILQEYHNISGKYPQFLHSDNGSEFISNDYKNLLKSLNITPFYGMTYLPQNQSMVERYNKTIKNAIFIYISQRKSQNLRLAEKYYDALPQIVQNYNNSYHTSIKNTPATIHNPNRLNKKQIQLVEKRVEKFSKSTINLPDINLHSHCRLHILTKGINRKKKRFAKSYHPQFSLEIYQVIRRIHLNDPLLKPKYKVKMIKDAQGNEVDIVIPKFYYRHDLLLIPN